MARRTKAPGRLELRKAAEAAERLEEENKPMADKAAKKTVKKKTVRKRVTKKKVVSQRLKMVWGVFDNSNQQIASFPYSDRGAADAKVSEMGEKGRGPYFVQPVKEPIPEEDEPEAEK